MKDKVIITRKIALIPMVSEHNLWFKRFNFFVDDEFTRIDKLLINLESEINNTKNEEKRSELENRKTKAEKLLSDLENYRDNGHISKKLLNNYVYGTCVKASFEEARHKNLCISKVIDTLRIHGYSDLSTPEAKELFRETYNAAVRIKNGSVSDFVDNPLKSYGLSWSNSLKLALIKDINRGAIDCKKGTVRQFKNDSPFSIPNTAMSFTHGYESEKEFLDHINDKDAKLFFNLGGNGKPSVLKFRLNLGTNPYKRSNLTDILLKVYDGTYDVRTSSIQVSGSKIILNLVLAVPKTITKLRNDVAVGVILGRETALVAATNKKNREILHIGSKVEIDYYRNYFRKGNRELQSILMGNSNNHGYRKKTQMLQKRYERQKNFAKNFNHKVSRGIVDYAYNNKASVIRMPDFMLFKEDFGDDFENMFILGDWSLYELQNMIETKADRVGIAVEYVKAPDFKKTKLTDDKLASKLASGK